MNYYLTLCNCLILALNSLAQTTATKVRLRTEPAVRKVIIEYELPQMLSTDSLYLELETTSGRIIRPVSVNGDVGKNIQPGKNKLIAWDVVRDNVRIDEDVRVLLRVARVVTVTGPAPAGSGPVASEPVAKMTSLMPAVKPTNDRVSEPGEVVRHSRVVPIIGWVAVAGLAAYGTVLYLRVNEDKKEYNAAPKIVPRAELARYQELSASIHKNQKTLNIVAGAAGVLAVANVVYMIVRKPARSRTSLLIQPSTQLTSIGLIRRF